jgi:phosphatidylglycerophosphatase A
LKGSLKRTLSERVSLILASGLGIGFIPPMPGTLGSLEGIILAYFTKDLSFGIKLIVFFLLTLLGIITAEVASKALQDEDPDEVVIDEIAGSYLSVLWQKAFLTLPLPLFYLG